MGAYLTQPVTEKKTAGAENTAFIYGASAMQGWRTSMEDAHSVVLDLEGDPYAGFFGVFDGHGGKEVARFNAQYMVGELARLENWKQGNIREALVETFLRMDRLMVEPASKAELTAMSRDDHQADAANSAINREAFLRGHADNLDGDDGQLWQGPTAGSTAVVAVVKGGVLHVANAGDSRCVLARGRVAQALSEDHKPTNPVEAERIMRAGGFVSEGRVNGSLNLSRALGDMEYKQSRQLPAAEQAVTAMPDVRSVALQAGDAFLILACDGIWDVLSNQEAVDFVWEQLGHGRTPLQIAEDMCDRCLAPDTEGPGKGCDNMSVIVVLIKQTSPEP